MGWLIGTGAFECQVKGYHNTLIRVRKNADFDYLYIQKQYHGAGIKRGDTFIYAGIFCKKNGRIYDAQYIIKDLFDELDGLKEREAETLHNNLQTSVRNAVESAVGNDRGNLSITELSSERELEKLTHFQKYSAGEQARKAYLDSDDEEEDGVFDFTYCCDYRPDQWTEDSLLEYILDPEEYVSSEAKAYLDNHQEDILFDFLASDMVAEAYVEIINNPSYPVHRVKRIMWAVSASSAKTVTVTIRKNGTDFTFKAEAGPFRSDCTNYYSNWNMTAAVRNEFERLYGRGEHYGPEDILRIEYARSILYEEAAAHE